MAASLEQGFARIVSRRRARAFGARKTRRREFPSPLLREGVRGGVVAIDIAVGCPWAPLRAPPQPLPVKNVEEMRRTLAICAPSCEETAVDASLEFAG